MYNYDHEIEMPKDKAMRKFLWDDYFHDSAVRSIAFQEKGVLRITLVSCLDQEEAYARIKGTEAEKREYLIKNEDKFVYYLYFENVFHFSLQSAVDWTEYINGRFKDSACLRIMQTWTSAPLYHLRMQFADGFCDVVFKSFKIRKKIGRINYRRREEIGTTASIPMDSHYFSSKESKIRIGEGEENYFHRTANFEKYLAQAESGEDFDRFIAMTVLYEKKYESLLAIARKNLILDPAWMDSGVYAAYLLGKLGTKEDIRKLYEYHAFLNKTTAGEKNYPYNTFSERTVLDSIEMLSLKSEENEK